MKIEIYLEDKVVKDSEIKVTRTENGELLLDGYARKMIINPIDLCRSIKILFDDLFISEWILNESKSDSVQM